MSASFRLAVCQVTLAPWRTPSPQKENPRQIPEEKPAPWNFHLGELSRALVLSVIESNPGIAVPEIVRDHDITVGRARGAVVRLEDSGLIRRVDRENGLVGFERVPQ